MRMMLIILFLFEESPVDTSGLFLFLMFFGQNEIRILGYRV